MNDAPRGTSGDRRRNPFPSLTDTEYELFMATIREEARIEPRVKKAKKKPYRHNPWDTYIY